MSEWLTTGEMIDQLKIGEVAQAYEESRSVTDGLRLVCEVVRTSEYYRPFLNKTSDNNFVLNQPSLKYKWRILPKYVSFNEAMKARKEGKQVKLHTEKGRFFLNETGHTFPFKDIQIGELTIDDLLEGKWTIVE